MSIRHNSLFRLPYDGSDLVIVIQVVDIDVSLHQCLLVLTYVLWSSGQIRSQKDGQKLVAAVLIFKIQAKIFKI